MSPPCPKHRLRLKPWACLTCAAIADEYPDGCTDHGWDRFLRCSTCELLADVARRDAPPPRARRTAIAPRRSNAPVWIAIGLVMAVGAVGFALLRGLGGPSDAALASMAWDDPYLLEPAQDLVGKMTAKRLQAELAQTARLGFSADELQALRARIEAEGLLLARALARASSLLYAHPRAASFDADLGFGVWREMLNDPQRWITVMRVDEEDGIVGAIDLHLRPIVESHILAWDATRQSAPRLRSRALQKISDSPL